MNRPRCRLEQTRVGPLVWAHEIGVPVCIRLEVYCTLVPPSEYDGSMCTAAEIRSIATITVVAF